VSSHNLRELEDVCDHVGIMKKGKMLLQRALSEMQDNLVKIQIALPEGAVLPEDLTILHRGENGRLQQLILRGKSEEITARLAALQPVFMDSVPLTLEEIFIYELGGADHEISDLVV
jgi:ABC-2 type transport system ATP-binding protein